MSKFSIITVNLDNKNGLEETILSVIEQTYSDYKYIVIDGNSTDGSSEVLSKYKEYIDYSISEPDNGIFNAMNKGIAKAKSEYCLFLNSGDRFAHKKVIENVNKLDISEDIVYGQQLIKKGGSLEVSPFLKPQFITLKSFIKSTLPHQCTFIKRELFSKIGLYNEDNKMISDWEFNLVALFKYNCSLRNIDIPISIFDINGISNKQEYRELHNTEKEKALLKHFPRIISDYDYFNEIENYYLNIPKAFRKIFKILNR